MPRPRSLFIALIVALIAFWAVAPMARAMLLLRDAQQQSDPIPHIDGRRATFVSFYTTNDDNPIPIDGWQVVAHPKAPTVILIPGWKDDKSTMLPYAGFLVKGGLNVLLIDLQGSGHSGGSFTLGLNEPNDVLAAVSYLDTVPSLQSHVYGLLGVSFGAGVAIMAAAPGPGDLGIPTEIRAVVADSPWATEQPTIDHLNQIKIGRLAVPLVPDAGWAVDQTLGGKVKSISTVQSASRLQKGQALLLIHSAHDDNSTTTTGDVQQIYQAAKTSHATVPKPWLAPLGGHAEAYAAQPQIYAAKVLRFFHRYLKAPKVAPSSQHPGAGSPLGQPSHYHLP